MSVAPAARLLDEAEGPTFARAGGLRWRVRRLGSRGPSVVMIHGTGASIHSYRKLAPLLADRARLFLFDLPGHGLSEKPRARAMGLDAMTRAVCALLEAEGVEAEVAIGHSAGAAIAVRAALDGAIAPRRIIGLNAALLPSFGSAGPMFASLARLLALNPLAPRVAAWRAGNLAVVRRLIGQTGSALSAEDLAAYQKLFRQPGHCAAALEMMAHWNLPSLRADLPRLRVPLTLIVGEGDTAIPPSIAEETAALAPTAQIVALDGLGHLAHEERPDRVAMHIAPLLDAAERAPARGETS